MMLTASRSLSGYEAAELADTFREWEASRRRGTILLPYGVTPVWEPLKPRKPNRYPSMHSHKVTR